LAHAGSEEGTKPGFESRTGVECELWEDGIQSRKFSWFQASEGSSKLLPSEEFRDTVTLGCRNLPQVVMLLVDEPGGLAAPSLVCPVLHELQGDVVCRDVAYAIGASRPASKFVYGSPRLAARVREVDGVYCFLQSLLLLLFMSR